MDYQAPLKDMMFVIRELADIEAIRALPEFADATDDTIEAVLNEAAKFSSGVLAPLNEAGDRAPSSWKDGVVTTTKGFKDAFRGFVEGGWQGVQHSPDLGGQGLPKLLGTACNEMSNSANLSFALCPLLTDGAIEALVTAGSEALQQAFIPPMIEGRYTGTMNLTEPQAGSDLSLVKTRAEPQQDGTYRVFGQKIFITYGEHDMAENIVHLVLARIPGGPEGVKGISLFVVPKFVAKGGLDALEGAAGKGAAADSTGDLQRNDVYCASIEHKLGIKGSPTAVLVFGDGKGEVGEGAIGYLVGQEHRGLEYMFVMMNAARFAVGMQGVAIAEAAYQKAVAYARERIQSRAVEGSQAAVPIIRHPDVRRMLMTMRSLTEGARALAYVGAGACDLAHAEAGAEGAADGEAAARRKAQLAFYEFLVPIIKGFSTEMSVEVASLGVQVHGGMGFIEETGAAQLYRDARILPVYEGTTAIQANDLIGRKTLRDGGKLAHAVIEQARATSRELSGANDESMKAIGLRLGHGLDAMADAVDALVEHGRSDPRLAFSGSVPFLMLCGTVLGGWQLARAAAVARKRLAEGQGDAEFMKAKIATARFHAEHILPRAQALKEEVVSGAQSTMAMDEAAF